MKYTELNKFIDKNHLLEKNVKSAPGFYAITIDGYIAYIGQSKDVRQRCGQHIYNTENAMLVQEPKYLLLLSAKLGGHKVDCEGLGYAPVEELLEKEMTLIRMYKPCLNIVGTDNDVYSLKIEDVLNNLKYYQNEDGFIMAKAANN